ncbi:hypothetical protein ACIDI_64c00010 [Acidiphilium sp. JA12-A1]|nr:hypothetical protein ACIDI_64c00010 [Acidiphilium sp. JA12-A1]
MATPELKEKVRHDLWGDMCAEHDAENLWDHICNKSGLTYSKEFLAAMHEWRIDEQNHYIGLRQICSYMYEVGQDEIDHQLDQRKPDFGPISHFISDEFKICVVLAYDELVSARGYKMFVEEFKQFGPKEYVTWVLNASRDEALHYQNFLDVAKVVHHGTRAAVDEIMRDIVLYETNPEMTYNATFLMDHTEETFERSFLVDCATTVAANFSGL